MMIYFGADHRGFALKEALKSFAANKGHEVIDLGAAEVVPGDDFTEYAAAVAKKVEQDPEHTRGVVMCGSGVGVDVVANRFKKVRSALVASPDQAYAARHDDDANVLALAADFMSADDAQKILNVFLVTPFGDANRYLRRIAKMDEPEIL
jgi:ribose 5-phosphate isomerase B